MGLVSLEEETPELSPSPSVSAQRKGRVNIQQEASCPRAGKKVLPRIQACWPPHVRLGVSRTVRNEYLLLQPPSLGYFVKTA